MFLHLGGATIINKNEIIVIQNLEKINFTEWFQQNSNKEKILDIADGNPKSAIFTDEKVILSPISSLTLKRRLKQALA